MKIGALSSYIIGLYNAGLVVSYKSPQTERKHRREIISLGSTNATGRKEGDDSVEQYFDDLYCRNYGMLLCNGGLIQVAYSLEKRKLVSHRYCYIPPPLNFTNRKSILDFADKPNKESIINKQIFLRSRIRFDYNKGHEDDIHPESHFTFISDDCRIPVRGGLAVKQFIRFIFKNFVDSRAVAENDKLFRQSSIATGTISDFWSKEIHLSWKS